MFNYSKHPDGEIKKLLRKVILFSQTISFRGVVYRRLNLLMSHHGDISPWSWRYISMVSLTTMVYTDLKPPAQLPFGILT